MLYVVPQEQEPLPPSAALLWVEVTGHEVPLSVCTREGAFPPEPQPTSRAPVPSC